MAERTCRWCKGPMRPRRKGESNMVYMTKKLCSRQCQIAECKRRLHVTTGLGIKRSGEPRR